MHHEFTTAVNLLHHSFHDWFLLLFLLFILFRNSYSFILLLLFFCSNFLFFYHYTIIIHKHFQPFSLIFTKFYSIFFFIYLCVCVFVCVYMCLLMWFLFFFLLILLHRWGSEPFWQSWCAFGWPCSYTQRLPRLHRRFLYDFYSLVFATNKNNYSKLLQQPKLLRRLQFYYFFT